MFACKCERHTLKFVVPIESNDSHNNYFKTSPLTSHLQEVFFTSMHHVDTMQYVSFHCMEFTTIQSGLYLFPSNKASLQSCTLLHHLVSSWKGPATSSSPRQPAKWGWTYCSMCNSKGFANFHINKKLMGQSTSGGQTTIWFICQKLLQ